MKKYNNALVIGKFYPPHMGHHHLINTAMKDSRHTTVLVMGSSFDSISPEERRQLLLMVHGGTKDRITVKAVYDHVYDDYHSNSIWAAHNELIRQAVDGEIDAVFTSEGYGDELASLFHAEHICVDVERKTYRISGTAVREDMFRHWSFLNDTVKRHYKTNIVVMGGESTGTSTLSEDLANHYRRRGGVYADTGLVLEYGREYAERRIEVKGDRNLSWSEQDFWHIAATQDRMQSDQWRNTRSPILINDTDSVATQAFADYYGVPKGDYGVHALPADLYFITDHRNMPLEDDGSRLTDKDARDKSTQFFIDTVEQISDSKQPWVLITGTRQERLDTAVKIIDNVVKRKISFTAPI